MNEAINAACAKPPAQKSKAAKPRTNRRQGILLPVQPHMDLKRNAPCPCGSGKKAKKCCLRRLSALSGLPPVVRTQALVAGILGRWPTVEPPKPIPAAVQQRFNELAAQKAAVTVPIESAVIHDGNTTINCSSGTLTLGSNNDAATPLENDAGLAPPAAAGLPPA